MINSIMCQVRGEHLEIILPCNQHNWIDVNVLENNAFFEVLAQKLALDLKLEFDELYTEKMNVAMDVKLHDGCARFYVPPTNSNLVLLKLLKKNIKYLSAESGLQTSFESKNWSRFNKTKVGGESANENSR